MIYKIVFQDEIHRVRSKATTLEEFRALIVSKFNEKVPKNFLIVYSDSDGDFVTLITEEDFSIMLEECESMKSVKMQVKENPNGSFEKVVVEPKEPIEDKPAQEEDSYFLDVLKNLQKINSEKIAEEKEEFIEIKEEKEENVEEKVPEVVIESEEKAEEVSNENGNKNELETIEVEFKPEMIQEKIEPEISQEDPKQPEEEEANEEALETLENENKRLKECFMQMKKQWKKGKGKKCKKMWKKKCWQKKKQWMQNKFDERFDEKLREVIPQIAVHVAQILKNDNVPLESFAPLKNIKDNQDQCQVIHKGFVCDGCGVGPIKGVCYKCSVCKDFDFCATCEEKVPHAHPFLKLKTPEQRPHAVFMMINEEGQQPFKPGQKGQDQFSENLFAQAQKMFSAFTQGGQHERKNWCKKFKKCDKKLKQACPMKFMKMLFKGQNLDKKCQEKQMNQNVQEPKQKKEEPKKDNSKELAETANQLMSMFNIPEDLKTGLCKWISDRKMTNIGELVQAFLTEDVMMQLTLQKSLDENEPKAENKLQEEELKKEKVELDETRETLETQVDEDEVFIQEEKEEQETKGKTEEEKVDLENLKVVVEDVDSEVNTNMTNKLVEVFCIDESNKQNVQNWVASKGNKTLEELVNLYMTEML